MPSWDALSLHCKRANCVLKIIFSACRSSTKCTTLGMYEEYGWKVVDGKIVVNWGLSETSILDNKHTTCGCRSGCNTRRCTCYNASQKCTYTCRCTNCLNVVSNNNPVSLSSQQQQTKNATTVTATEEEECMQGASIDSEEDSEDDCSDSEKIEVEVIHMDNNEIMDWEDFMC